jgi:uncharacterized membrane protein
MEGQARLAQAFAIAGWCTAAEILRITAVVMYTRPAEAALYAGALWSLLKCAPLLILLPGLRRHSHRHAVWLCFALCLYFPLAVLEAFGAPPLAGAGLLGVGLTSLAFVAGLLAARWSRNGREPPLPLT